MWVVKELLGKAGQEVARISQITANTLALQTGTQRLGKSVIVRSHGSS
jgi:hypothetical protein